MENGSSSGSNVLHNNLNQLDVNIDGIVSPLDALLVINVLNRFPELPWRESVRAASTIGNFKVDTAAMSRFLRSMHCECSTITLRER